LKRLFFIGEDDPEPVRDRDGADNGGAEKEA
jgi:hypothetical protein